MYEDAKKTVQKHSYSSISELIRHSLRKTVYPELTINGFTKEFEDGVLKAAKGPDTGILIETEEDLEKYFEKIRQRVKNNSAKS